MKSLVAIALAGALAACAGPRLPDMPAGWQAEEIPIWEGAVRGVHLAPDGADGIAVAADVVVASLRGRQWQAKMGVWSPAAGWRWRLRDFGIRLSGATTDTEGEAWLVVADQARTLTLARPGPSGWATQDLGDAGAAALIAVLFHQGVRHTIWTDRRVRGQEVVWHEWDGPTGKDRERVADRVVCCLDAAIGADGTLAFLASVPAASSDTAMRVELLRKEPGGEWERHGVPRLHSRHEQAVMGRGPDVAVAGDGGVFVGTTLEGAGVLWVLQEDGSFEEVLDSSLGALGLAPGPGDCVQALMFDSNMSETLRAVCGGSAAGGIEFDLPGDPEDRAFHEVSVDGKGLVHFAYCRPIQKRVFGYVMAEGCGLTHLWGPMPPTD